MARNQDFGPRDVRTIKSILDDYVRTRSFVNPRERSARVGRMRHTHFSFLKNHLDNVDATLFLDEMRTLLRRPSEALDSIARGASVRRSSNESHEEGVVSDCSAAEGDCARRIPTGARGP